MVPAAHLTRLHAEPLHWPWFFFVNVLILMYLFLAALSLSCGEWGPLLLRPVGPRLKPQWLQHSGSVDMARGPRGCGVGNPPEPGMHPSPAWAGRLLAPRPTGKPCQRYTRSVNRWRNRGPAETLSLGVSLKTADTTRRRHSPLGTQGSHGRTWPAFQGSA